MKLILALILSLIGAQVWANPLENPGFENGNVGWQLKDGMSSVVPDAARSGTMGLRVKDEDPKAGSGPLSSRFPVTAGQAIELVFHAKTTTENFGAVYLWFYDAAGVLVKDPTERVGQGFPLVAIANADGQWHDYHLKKTAPAGVASVAVWIHSFGSAVGVCDFDDFELLGLDSNAAPVVVAVTPPPLDFSARKTPPLIVIKVDDFRPIDGKVHGLWLKYIDYMASRQLKSGIGVVMETVPTALPEFNQWVKSWQASGQVEFWFHGWDHAAHEVDGVKYNEFSHRSYEEQKRHFDQGQQLAIAQFGFPFATFGPPGGVGSGFFSDNTVRVMADDSYMKVWLYPQPMDAAGKALSDAGKVTVLDRVWEVNIEYGVGRPNFQKFSEGYAKHPDRTYFVLQGHPMHWSPDRFAEFAKIIEFLVEQKAEFLTPSELAARLKQP
jgi:peptidoglycan/xylan/chitin deacetylase (PgdA/CDA1 family)